MKLFPVIFVALSGMIVFGGYCHATTIRVPANQSTTRLFRVDYAPTVPVPIRPVNDELINSHEDSLWVWNSFDADNDSLTYDYQLFCACCGLIEALFYYDVPEGHDSTGVTAYMLDVQDENCQVLWRARANDGYQYSGWCEVQSYYVNNEEEPPSDFGLIWPPDTGWSQVYDFPVNIGDGVFLINYIFKGGAAPYPLKIGDVNADCAVNIADAVYLVDYIFKGGPPPGIGCAE